MSIAQEAVELHKSHSGKLEVKSKVPLRDGIDLSLAYTPGVAEPCRLIKDDPSKVYDYTLKANSVAVISDGSRVLGLGNIGPEAGLPVMEGKAVLFKEFGGVDAFPICLNVGNEEEFIQVARALAPSFGGFNLEDIATPKCYDIEDRLKEELNIPVFHDDQHGTAAVALAGVIGGLRLVGKRLDKVNVVVNGAGAAGTAIARLLLHMGAGHLSVCDVDGLLNPKNSRLNRVQMELASKINPSGRTATLEDVIGGADVLIGVSAPGAFTMDLMKRMAKDSIVFAMANPVPETDRESALIAGVRVFGTGKSGEPNQVNNVLVFPGIFRGALDVRARKINEEMKVAAVKALVSLVSDDELTEDHVIPDPFDRRVAPAVAKAVASTAVETGVSRICMNEVEINALYAKRLSELS